MSQQLYRKNDVNPEALSGQKITILGYGSQGRAHALNLRDRGAAVTVGLRKGSKSWAKAEHDKFQPQTVENAVQAADVVVVLVPDMNQPDLFKDVLHSHVKDGALVIFAHGFCVHYKLAELKAEWDVALVAPKAPGNLVRREFEKGRGVPCLLAVHQDQTGTAFERTLAYADALGGTHAGVFHTSFAEETETDLFGEQAVLCGGVTNLLTTGWEVLVEQGYSPEVAYFECLHEMKLIVDLLHEGGLSRMHQFVSDTASYGDLTRGERVVDSSVRVRMREVLEEIRNGDFAKEWAAENHSGSKQYRNLLEKKRHHPIEEVGSRLRKSMHWLGEDHGART